jgi:hypothetical protein
MNASFGSCQWSSNVQQLAYCRTLFVGRESRERRHPTDTRQKEDTPRLPVSRAMQAARRRVSFDFTSRLGRRAEAGPRQLAAG